MPSGGQNEVEDVGSGSTSRERPTMRKTTATTAAKDAMLIPVMSP